MADGRHRAARGRARDVAARTALAAWRALQGFYNRDHLTYAASIAYYALLSLFPLNGSIGAVIVFLMWVYVQAAILLYGAEFTAAYARMRRTATGGEST